MSTLIVRSVALFMLMASSHVKAFWRSSRGAQGRTGRTALLCHFCSTHNFPSEPNCFCASILDGRREDQAERSSQMKNGNCPVTPVSRTTKSQVDNITTRLDDHLTSPGATPTFLALAWTPFTAAALINCASPSKQAVEEMKGIYIGKSWKHYPAFVPSIKQDVRKTMSHLDKQEASTRKAK